MSRTEEDISSRVDVPIMRNTTLSTYPASYSELCDTFRPRLGVARRTVSGGERFIHFLVPSSVRSRFVAEHASEGRPACIEDGFRQAGLGESGGVHVADRNMIELSNDESRAFMVKVTAGIGDMPACIAGEVRAVLDLAFGERAGVKHPEGLAGKAEGLPLALEIPALQGHPAQRAPAPPAQEWAVPLTAGLGVLLANSVDGAGMQGKILAAPRSQAIQIKTARPALVPLQSLKLSIVAEIPDEIAGARLAVEESGEGLDAVSIHQQHRRKLMPSQRSDKSLKLTETSIFGDTKSPPQEKHFLPGAGAGISVPERR
jgi:hypothetical protein